MFCSIESVTVGVGNLESSLQFFRDRLGMRVVNDTRASVGLVAAWRRPVHESVRLVDLASAAAIVAPNAGGKKSKPVPASAKTLPAGRVRLAVYEDYALTAASRASSGNKTTAPASGPWAIELASGGEAASGKLMALSGPDDLLVLAAEGAEPLNANATSNQHATQLASVCVSSSNLTAATRFYTEALGLQSFNDPQILARLPANSASQAVAFGSKDNAHPKIVVTSFDPPQSAQQLPTSMAVGQLGFNLINIRCDDLDELQKRIHALGIKPITEPAHVGMPFGYPGRVMIVVGPDGELFEFDEIVV